MQNLQEWSTGICFKCPKGLQHIVKVFTGTPALIQNSNASAVLQDSPPQQGLTAAYQGNPGAYSEGAVLAAFPDGHPVPCEHFEDAFQALSQYLTDRAVLPIENSLGGSIHAVYDLLIQ